MQENYRCRRCFLKDIAPETYMEHVKILLNKLDIELKTEETLYQSRLKECAGCDNLVEGICRICGCFVEYRAAIKLRGCPAIHPKW